MNKLIRIDELHLGDHPILNADDECYYLGEYTSGAGFTASATNSLIANFKKGVDRKGKPEYQYKGRAIRKIARLFENTLNTALYEKATIIPIPPSKCKTDPLYDDRMTLMLNRLCQDRKADIRELLEMNQTIRSSHEAKGNRPSVEEIENNLVFKKEEAEGTSNTILLFDDVITAGSHYRACKNVLAAHFPHARIIGVFVARRVLPEEDWDDIFD